jgi:hypothetical protein
MSEWIPLFKMNALWAGEGGGGQCNMVNHLEFLDYVKAFDKETYCLKHYKAKYCQLLICSGNKVKVKKFSQSIIRRICT